MFRSKRADQRSSSALWSLRLSGTLPFYADNPDDFLELVLSSSFSFPDSEWADVGEEARDLIKKILVPDPKKRLTVRQILAHPWLAVSRTLPRPRTLPFFACLGYSRLCSDKQTRLCHDDSQLPDGRPSSPTGA